jgi:hypothetical protein
MKNLFLAAVTALSLFSCEDNDQNPNVLPLATQTGKNTGGALVNGDVWVAKIENLSLANGANATVYENANGIYKLRITFNHLNDDSGMAIIIQDNKEITEQSYILSKSGFGFNEFDNCSFAVYNKYNSFYYQTSEQYKGIVTITKFDKTKQIVCGTFYFDAIDRDNPNDSIKITQGRFDKRFSN